MRSHGLRALRACELGAAWIPHLSYSTLPTYPTWVLVGQLCPMTSLPLTHPVLSCLILDDLAMYRNRK
jgi:hypothetical protein